MNKEIKISKKFILLLILINVIALGLYYSYALFTLTTIQKGVVVLNTGTIGDITVNSSQTIQVTVPANGKSDVTIDLNTTDTKEIAYKLYYTVNSGDDSNLTVNAALNGTMTSTKNLTFTLKNKNASAVTITIGAKGGLVGYDVLLDEGQKEFTVKVKPPTSSDAIMAKLNENNSDTDSDDVTYISGCGDEETIDGTTCTEANKIDFNFVWYSGKLWRVVAIYPDGEMKLVTENPITTIYWGADETYSTSWVREWLNQDFKDTLVNQDKVLISNDDNFYWNAKMTTATTKQAKDTATAFTDTVGMLDAYEYTESYKKASDTYDKGYLNIKQSWWLITPYSSSRVRGVYSNGDLYSNSTSSRTSAVRPSIYLSSGITFAGGAGTRNNPYRIGEDISAPTTNAKISSRASGEYVMFKNELFRIVGKEGETTKIVKADYLLDGSSVLKKKFGETSSSVIYGQGTSDNTWDYYLNNTWLTEADKTLLDQGTYYLGEDGSTGSYKKTLCATTNDNTNYTKTTKECDKITSTYTGYAGLLRVGEMFSSQLKTSQSSYQYMWLITPYSSSTVRAMSGIGILSNDSPSSGTCAVRPSVNLKSNIIITDGAGTEQDPFEIAIGSES